MQCKDLQIWTQFLFATFTVKGQWFRLSAPMRNRKTDLFVLNDCYRYVLKIPFFGFSILLLGLSVRLLAQGCSDAGVCSIGSMKPSLSTDPIQSGIGLSTSFGLGEADGALIPIWTAQVEGILKITPSSYINLKLPFQIAHGNLGTTYGPGDIALSISQVLSQDQHKRTTITVGGIFPTNDADKQIDGKGLPMIYQTSLGSYDLIIGASHLRGRWQFAVGYQHPFNRNKNGFLHSEWPDNEDALAYFESNRLKRGDDLIFRAGKLFYFSNSTLYLGLLPIIRLQKDEIIKEGEVLPLDGSRGLTLNLNLSWHKPLSERLDFKLVYGNPIIWRQTRADGLTRPVVITASLNRRF